MSDLNLTPDEQAAMDATVQLANALGRVVGNGATRADDLAELVAPIHVIQHAIMAQPFARAHPDQYRLLGEVIEP